jgi:hypothetical protein
VTTKVKATLQRAFEASIVLQTVYFFHKKISVVLRHSDDAIIDLNVGGSKRDKV